MNEKYSQKEFSSTMVNYVYIFVYSATVFLLAAVRVPDQVQELVVRELHHPDATQRINAILRFGVLWRHRWQVWPRMEDGANMFFKVTTQKQCGIISIFSQCGSVYITHWHNIYIEGMLSVSWVIVILACLSRIYFESFVPI